MKVRMQSGAAPARLATKGAAAAAQGLSLPAAAREVASLYRGVLSAATGAGVIIGAYFAFYSTTKRFLRQRTSMGEGQMAFVSGGVAAVGSGVVKVPIAVCIRSVQAGVYPTVFQAARSIVAAAGSRGLFTGFLPTLMEDVPDMAVKFAVYETLRAVHMRITDGRQPSTAEDLLMGGSAGGIAAAATTPLDVIKTRMMCSASSRPTITSAVRGVLAEGEGARAFFRGVGPRALSNGLNSAVFFCFFEAFRRVLVRRQQEAADAAAAKDAAAAAGEGKGASGGMASTFATMASGAASEQGAGSQLHLSFGQVQADVAEQQTAGARWRRGRTQQLRPAEVQGTAGGPRLACLTLALPALGAPAAAWW